MNNLWSDLHIIFPSVLAGKNPGHKFTSVASLPRKSNRTRWKASEWLMNDDQKPSWTWTQDTASHGFAYSGQYTMHVKHKLNGVIVNLQELLVELQSFCIDKYWQGCLDKICSSNSEGSRQGYQRHHLPLIFPFGCAGARALARKCTGFSSITYSGFHFIPLEILLKRLENCSIHSHSRNHAKSCAIRFHLQVQISRPSFSHNRSLSAIINPLRSETSMSSMWLMSSYWIFCSNHFQGEYGGRK